MVVAALDDARKQQLGATIRALRQAKGWSHAQLAKRATEIAPYGRGLSAKTVGNIEAGRHNPTLSSLLAIASALDIEIWQLFLPPATRPDLVRDATNEFLRRDEDAQRAALEMIRRLAVPPRQPSRNGGSPEPSPPP